MNVATPYELSSPEAIANPYPIYAAMRAQDPVCYQAAPTYDGNYQLWYITRYADAEAILRDHKRFVKSYRSTLTPEQLALEPPLSPLERMLNFHLLNRDGADHTRLRTLINKAFTAQMVQQLQDRVQHIADDLLDRVQSRGQMDLIDEYAFPLPIVVIAELLGVSATDRDRFRVWSDAFVSPQATEAEFEAAKELMVEFLTYLGRVFAERRAAPQNDLITALTQAEEAGDKLSEDELYSMVVLLIVAGHETTVNLIGNGMLALLRNPAQLALLKANPALVPNAVEEFLRYDGPVERATMRFAAEDVEIGGQLIRRGQAVSVVLASADHDVAQFAHPEQLDVTRSNNRHLGFGFGVHYCVGAPLARLEGRIAISTLLQRLPDLRLAEPPETLVWRPNLVLRGLRHLPVVWG
jgi:cytochrome P450